MSGAWRLLRDGTLLARDAGYDLANVETVRLAVTGLSRAGKTVFLVSVISNLLAMVRERQDTLPALSRALSDEKGLRLLEVAIEPTGTQRIPRFAYEALRDAMAGGEAARWPAFTDHPSLITLRLRLRPRTALGALRGALLGPREVRLELLDYPGEWLVDLPLLEQSFEAWSAEAVRLLGEEPRAPFAREFLTFLGTLRADAPDSEEVALHGFRLYREALRRCREEAGLRWLQPGRFLMPGHWAEVPFLHFFPWPAAAGAARGTLGAQLRERFEAYKTESRRDFFEPHFSAFNRQVVLVDVLGALWAGRTAFEDTRRALHAIGDSYRRLLERQWLPGRRIERVAFVATKSDHAADINRDHLRATLRAMVLGRDEAPREAEAFFAAAAARCTEDGAIQREDGGQERVVFGVPLGGDRQRPFRTGVLPAGPVPEAYWGGSYMSLPQFAPPAFRPGAPHPIAHLQLDEVLAALLGDVL